MPSESPAGGHLSSHLTAWYGIAPNKHNLEIMGYPRRIEQEARFLAAGADVIAIADKFRDMRAGYEKAGLSFNAGF